MTQGMPASLQSRKQGPSPSEVENLREGSREVEGTLSLSSLSGLSLSELNTPGRR